MLVSSFTIIIGICIGNVVDLSEYGFKFMNTMNNIVDNNHLFTKYEYWNKYNHFNVFTKYILTPWYVYNHLPIQGRLQNIAWIGIAYYPTNEPHTYFKDEYSQNMSSLILKTRSIKEDLE